MSAPTPHPDAPVRALVWNENVHERENEIVAGVYPDGIHGCIAGFLNRQPGIQAATATLQEPRHGIPPNAWPTPTCCCGGATPRTATSMTRWWRRWSRPSGAAWA